MKFSGKIVKMENMVLCKVTESKKKYHMFSLICRSFSVCTHVNTGY